MEHTQKNWQPFVVHLPLPEAFGDEADARARVLSQVRYLLVVGSLLRPRRRRLRPRRRDQHRLRLRIRRRGGLRRQQYRPAVDADRPAMAQRIDRLGKGPRVARFRPGRIRTQSENSVVSGT